MVRLEAFVIIHSEQPRHGCAPFLHCYKVFASPFRCLCLELSQSLVPCLHRPTPPRLSVCHRHNGNTIIAMSADKCNDGFTHGYLQGNGQNPVGALCRTYDGGNIDSRDVNPLDPNPTLTIRWEGGGEGQLEYWGEGGEGRGKGG